MTTQNFIEKSKKIFGETYCYEKTKYTNKSTKVIITCPIHGDFQQTPESHYKSTGCPICAKQKKNDLRSKPHAEEFIKKATLVHSHKYDYSKTIYTKARNKIKIICLLHGEFTQSAHSHLQGKGCPQCGTSERLKERISKRKSTEDFIKQANLVHSNKYDYSITEYTTAKTSLSIYCPIHGVFEQIPYNHLNGTGCPKCATKGWSDKEWEILAKKSKYFEAYYIYIIECWSTKERFIKVGKTFTNLSKRFTKNFPYQWKVLKIKEGKYKDISELERSLQKLIWKYKYKPKLPFSGQTECFTMDSLQFLDM